MTKNVIVAGLLGGLVLFAWTFVVNGFFRFQANIDMNQIPTEREVYEMLTEHIVEPGRYIFNPTFTPDGQFPGAEPVFSILYSGVGHQSAGGLMLFRLIVGFLTMTMGAWLLSQTSNRVRASYARKVMFFAVIGLLLAVFTDLTKFGIGDYPLKDALAFSANTVVVWTLVGLVVAWRIRPPAADMSGATS